MNFDCIFKDEMSWKKITAKNFDTDYAAQFLPRSVVDALFEILQKDEYFSGDLTQVKVFGKLHSIRIQEMAHGDDGLKYTFSGRTVPALPWPPLLLELRDLLTRIFGHEYNHFVFINRYRSGHDHIGEHRNDEKDLDRTSPIASLSLGQARDFVFRHVDARRSGNEKRDIPPIRLFLEYGHFFGSYRTGGKEWYDAMPQMKYCPGLKWMIPFRKMLPQAKSHT